MIKQQSPGYQHQGGGAPQLSSGTYLRSPNYKAEGGATNQGPYSPVYTVQSPVYSNPSMLIQGSSAQQLPQSMNQRSPGYSPSSSGGMLPQLSSASRPQAPASPGHFSPSYSPTHSPSLLQNMSSGQKSLGQANSIQSPYYPSHSPAMKFELSS